MERIGFIVERLNMPPFRKNISTMTELDSKSAFELLDYMCEIVALADPEQEAIYKEPTEHRVRRIMNFLNIMKFNIPSDQFEDFQNLLMSGDKEVYFSIMFWSLQRFEQLQKRAYLAKYLMPIDVPAEFLGDENVYELSERLKQLQAEFKEVHKKAEQVRATGVKPSDLKAEIAQLEQERSQLNNKIHRMKKDVSHDETRFKEMLKATSALRKEQENEVMIHERLRENRKLSQEADMKYNDINRRYNELKSSGVINQSADVILSKLHQDVQDLSNKNNAVGNILQEREIQLEKIINFDNTDNNKVINEDDVRMKHEEIQDIEDQINMLNERLDHAMEKNAKLVVFRQASSLALKKYRDKEEESLRLQEELKYINKQMDDKEEQIKLQHRQQMSGNGNGGNGNNGKVTKAELKRFGAIVKEKIEIYRKLRDELAAMRSELVVLQRTEQVLRSRDDNLEQLLSDLERQKGVEGYRDTQRAIIEMTEKAAEIDQMKGVTLEEISAMVEKISKEFKTKQQQLQPLIAELKAARQDHLEVESHYNEKKLTYEKVAVNLEMEIQTLEKECTQYQDEALREESKYYQLHNLLSLLKVKLERCEKEKKWQSGHEKMMRDFSSLRDLYNHKLTQQEQLTKQLRKKQKELKENSGALTNQKSNFMNLQTLLDAKMKLNSGESILTSDGQGGGNRFSMGGKDVPTAIAEPYYENAHGNSNMRATAAMSKDVYNNRDSDDIGYY